MSFDDVANRMKERHQPDYGAPMQASSGEGGGGLIVLGVILLIVGIAITVITKDNATRSGGGTYVVAYGPMIWGAVTIFRGLARLGR
ncbi:MAG: hypothetical protein JNL83_36235 [Myxococcales bacterium]|nr:hypothetical protein [Myxococcales bacterium]